MDDKVGFLRGDRRAQPREWPFRLTVAVLEYARLGMVVIAAAFLRISGGLEPATGIAECGDRGKRWFRQRQNAPADRGGCRCRRDHRLADKNRKRSVRRRTDIHPFSGAADIDHRAFGRVGKYGARNRPIGAEHDIGGFDLSGLRLAPGANRLNNFSDRVDHELRLLLVYLVAAVRVGDVFRIRHELGELLLGLFLRGIGDVAEVRRHISREYARRNH